MKIHEISEMLGIPKSTLRLYEKAGALSGQINEGNGYHEYSVWDVTLLLEVLKLRRIGFSIRESVNMVYSSSAEEAVESWRKTSRLLRKQIEEKEALINYLEFKSSVVKTARVNLGRSWVAWIPERVACRNMYSQRGQYSMDAEDRRLQISLMEMLPFSDAVIRIPQEELFSKLQSESGTWFVTFGTQYCKNFDFQDEPAFEIWPEHLALCTVIDAGDVGMFTQDNFLPLWDELSQSGYSFQKPYLYGSILSRTIKNGIMQRLVRLEIPIEDA